jgi:DNA mismatch repair ATPase MutL
MKKLDSQTSTALRRGQIITKLSDVVRELVDNAVDAGPTRIQVLLVSNQYQYTYTLPTSVCIY